MQESTERDDSNHPATHVRGRCGVEIRNRIRITARPDTAVWIRVNHTMEHQRRTRPQERDITAAQRRGLGNHHDVALHERREHGSTGDPRDAVVTQGQDAQKREESVGHDQRCDVFQMLSHQ